MTTKQREIATISILLVATAIFGFVLIPLGINDGRGAGAGLSPRFMPEVATLGIAVALLFGLLRHVFVAESNESPPTDDGTIIGQPWRAVAVMLICLFFSIVGFRMAGFYLGGVVMATALTLLLGERNVIRFLVFPILVLVVIYIVFEFGFQIRLPKSGLISSVPV